MANSTVVRPVGPTAALSVANTQHATVAISCPGFDQVNYASFINSGSTVVCATVTPIGTTVPTLVFPVDGTPTVPNSFILPASMTTPLVVAVPAGGFNLSAIGSAAGPSIIYVTPVGDQS